jgi:hypothetical protein
MPDPQRLWRMVSPTMFPLRQPGYLTTRANGRLAPVHMHNAYVDAKGDGSTSISAGHFHRIKAGAVLPDESDGHVHAIVRAAPLRRGI